MKNNVIEFKKKKADGKKNGFHQKKLIGIDLPFDYEEVVSITGSEYVRNLFRDGRTVLPYEELRRNVAGFLLKAIEKPKYMNISGFQVADYYYHSGHSWVHLEHDGRVRIGIDDFISKVFGPADTINLPPVGAFLKQGEVGWVLTRNGHKAPMQSPVSGTVFAVNDKVRKQPEIAQGDPYEEGWLFLIDPADLKLNLKGLYFGKECFEWMEKENRNLLEFLGAEYERLAATGGGLIDDIYGHFPEMDWDRMVRTFLRTK
uniref:Glycine cleavage system protein H n=1 Tax=Candidatus Desulfatibia profunda TaxID=2841695 RepID=A0A8J6NRS3_9BACT|nr:glycine cleavage system protein H [Candidatus Desulfatibia profunda]